MLLLIRQEQPDLVLLDIMMPQINGLDLLRHIRNDARWRNLPAIILTAYSDPATKREALEAGATDFEPSTYPLSAGRECHSCSLLSTPTVTCFEHPSMEVEQFVAMLRFENRGTWRWLNCPKT